MITVHLTRIPENGTLTQEHVDVALDALGLKAPFEAGSLHLSWELSRRLGQVYGWVRAEAGLTLPCGRCLEEFSAPVSAECKVLFEARPWTKPGHGGQARAESAEVDLSDDTGPTVVLFDGDEVPVGEEARQELELAVPFNPLCRVDCRGLCARCGANLNLGSCSCS